MNRDALYALTCLAEGGAPLRASGGVAVVLPLPAKDAKVLALKGGLPASELHCTLAYFGPTKDFDAAKLKAAKKTLTNWANGRAPIPALLGGIGRFPGNKEEGDPVYLPVDAPRLTLERPSLLHALRDAGLTVRQNHGFNAHVTLSYVPADEALPTQRVKPRSVKFDTVELWVGGKRYRFPLEGDPDTPEEALREAPTVESFMHPSTLNEMSFLAGQSALDALHENDEHQGQKMVFGTWRKVARTPQDHRSEASFHDSNAKAHEKAGIAHARKAGEALHAANHKDDPGGKAAYDHHLGMASKHLALSHAHGAVAKGHERLAAAAKEAGVKDHEPVSSKLDALHRHTRLGNHAANAYGEVTSSGEVNVPASQADAMRHPEHSKSGRSVASAHAQTAYGYARQGKNPDDADKHHIYLGHTKPAADPQESRSREGVLAEMHRIASTPTAAFTKAVASRKND